MPPKRKPRVKKAKSPPPQEAELSEGYDSDESDRMLNLEEEDLNLEMGSDSGNKEPKQENYEEIEEQEDEDDDLQDNVEVDDEDHQLSDSEVISDSEAEAETECLYDDKASDDEYEEVEEEGGDEPGFLDASERRTKPQLFHYEYVRLIEDRTEQILRGSKKLLRDSDHLHPIEVAKLELKHNMIPLKVIRTLPNGLKEIWKLKELDHSEYDKLIEG